VRVLVAGGAGFIGSNLVRHLLAGDRYRVRVLDKLTYAGSLSNFPDEVRRSPRFEFVRGDACSRATVERAMTRCDAVVNLVAETHIDRSIDDVRPFVRADFVSAAVMLEAARHRPLDRFVQVSTCEVYGSARAVPMAEDHPLEPQSPYAATKAGADRLCRAYHATHGLPVVILRPFNQYGPNQYPEKVIPFFYTSACSDRPLYVYGSGRNTRDWTYVPDFCRLVQRVLETDRKRVAGEVFNVGSGEERSSLDIARELLRALGKPSRLVQHTSDRPGHVERLVCDPRKTTRVLGWRATTRFAAGLGQTLDWYARNRRWWQRIMRRRQYQEFYRRWYGRTLGAGQAAR
jgi:dTDP-glucose 4,6-dehydratase